jgi:hypothetical protein
MPRPLVGLLTTVLCGVAVTGAIAARQQLGERAFSGSLDHPAIEYARQPTNDAVTALNRSLADQTSQLKFDPQSGYLRSLLGALHLPIESQMLVFSKTGVQRGVTSPTNPRALFFNDTVVVGYIRAAPFLELAALDPRQGAVFYTLDQQERTNPSLVRRDSCLSCHVSYSSLDVPGFLVRSQATATTGHTLRQLGSFVIDHRSPFEERWGGWYVTGTARGLRHMGNRTLAAPPAATATVTNADLAITSLDDPRGYMTPYSDVVALMVFEHQAHMMNLITRLGWETRVALSNHLSDSSKGVLREAVNEFADYMLFVDEAGMPAPITGSSGFDARFAALGPRDRKGRSLRDFDLRTRLFRYPCSYMVYSDAFDQLPAETREAIYRRLWQILSGQEHRPQYARLSTPDRRAIVEILRETKPGLPAYFR